MYEKKRLGNRRFQKGASIAELVVVLPAMALLGLGSFEAVLAFRAKSLLNFASYEGVRSGSIRNANLADIQAAVARGLTPLYGASSSNTDIIQANLKAKIDIALPYTRIEILNPTRQAFADFGVVVKGMTQIPNDNLIARSTAIGATSRVNIQDANLLKIRVTYGYRLSTIVARFVTRLMSAIDPANSLYYSNGRIPMVAQAVMHMQSPAYQQGVMGTLPPSTPGGSGGGSTPPTPPSGGGGPGGGNPGDPPNPPVDVGPGNPDPSDSCSMPGWQDLINGSSSNPSSPGNMTPIPPSSESSKQRLGG